ncbi:hypothetical protein [uncultured Microbulbifer sp.]|uniref:hypothetical protein n=1 Tax=uncultured Microbulbifer sp. TaxID=348147 RepID=UPI00260CCEEB|nr:hypothetical protein [uncultured Microbulbifer sp.]
MASSVPCSASARYDYPARSLCSEPWLTGLHEKKAPTVGLYRDPEQGFILLAHIETQGLYRNPHNHGGILHAAARGDANVHLGSV